jgi:hypothetical protein
MHCSFGSICVDYLNTCVYNSPLHGTDVFVKLGNRHPLLKYASRYILLHLCRSESLRLTNVDKLRNFLGLEKCASWIEYLAMLSLEDGSFVMLQSEFKAFQSWFHKGGYNWKLFEDWTQVRMNEELRMRIRKFGEDDPRTEQWRLFLDIIRVADTDSDRETTTQLPVTSANLYPIIDALNQTAILPLQRQVDILLRLQTYLQKTRVLTDPLKLLFRIILQKAPIIPVYALLAIGKFYLKLDKFREALEVYCTALTKVEAREMPVIFTILN